MKTKDRIKLRSWMSREEIERYLDEQDELELEELRMKTAKKYANKREAREKMLNDMWLESYDVWRDEQYEKEIEFEENGQQ